MAWHIIGPHHLISMRWYFERNPLRDETDAVEKFTDSRIARILNDYLKVYYFHMNIVC